MKTQQVIFNGTLEGPSRDEITLRLTVLESGEDRTVVMLKENYKLFECVYSEGLPKGILVEAFMDDDGTIYTLKVSPA